MLFMNNIFIFLIDLYLVSFHRITESQNGRGWKGALCFNLFQLIIAGPSAAKIFL